MLVNWTFLVILQTQFQLSNENKLSKQWAAQFWCPILSNVIFLEPQFFSLRSPSSLLKGLLWVQLLILPVRLHKHARSSLDHLWSMGLLCWNSHREPLGWHFSPPLGTQKESHISAIWRRLYQLFHSGPWGFHCAYRFLFSHFLGKQPSFLPWKDCHEPHNQPRYQAFSHGLSLALQVNPSSSGLSRYDQHPEHASFRCDIPVKISFTNHH